MAKMGWILLAALAVTAASVAAKKSSAAAPAPAPTGPDCSNVLLGLEPCLSYITDNSSSSSSGGKGTKPSEQCCSALVSIANGGNVTCLCKLFTSDNPLGRPVDLKKGTALSKACKANTPPISTCNAIGIPVAAPACGAAPSGAVQGSNSSSSSTTSSSPVTASPKNGALSLRTAIPKYVAIGSFCLAAIQIFLY